MTNIHKLFMEPGGVVRRRVSLFSSVSLILALIAMTAAPLSLQNAQANSSHQDNLPLNPDLMLDDEENIILPDGASEDWWATVQETIEESEYEITWLETSVLSDVEAGYQAPNRAQDLRIYFTEEGPRTVPRAEDDPSWEFGMTLKGWGYDDDIQPVAEAELSAEGNCIEYQQGSITEWYINNSKGVEQGFELSAPPPAEDSHGRELVLNLFCYGYLDPVLRADGESIDFITPGGVRVLTYDSLHVIDATGKELPASMAREGNNIYLRIDDTAAVYPLTVDPLVATPDWTAEGNQNSASFGISVSTAGDVNADGYDDVIVVAYQYDVSGTDECKAFVYHGSASGLSTSADWTVDGDQDSGNYGRCVANAGDVNNDGYDDVIVGAPYYDNGNTDECMAYVYHGSASGLSAYSDWMDDGGSSNYYFGVSVATAGDVNSDGYDDIIAGAHGYAGYARVYHGSASGPPVDCNWYCSGVQSTARMGRAVSTAGDINRDGYADVIIGAYYYDNGQTDEGRAFVYHGSASGLSTTANWTSESDQASAYFGYSVGTAGDVNGDGYSDIIVGAYHYDSGQTDEGMAFLYYGNGGAGPSLNPRQRTSDDSSPLSYMGKADRKNAFLLSLLGKTPFGRGQVKLQWEVKALGTAFNGTPTGESNSWIDTTTSGVEIDQLVEGLSASTCYHWRVRLHYNPATNPFQQYSRWISLPWKGDEEADFCTPANSAPVADNQSVSTIVQEKISSTSSMFPVMRMTKRLKRFETYC